MNQGVATTDEGQEEKKPSVVQISSQVIAKQYRIARFRGRPMVMELSEFPHFTPLHKDRFEQIAYPVLGGVSRSRMSDVFAYLGNTAEDLTSNEHLILFGVPLGSMDIQADTDIEHNIKNRPLIWDTQSLSFDYGADMDKAIWRSPYTRVVPPSEDDRMPFIMQLAGGDKGVYDDIMQSLAPLIMEKKPDGVIWWVGDGANGKSTLMDAIYRIFPGQLSSITVKRLCDGRDTPSLNGTLANIVKESSEGRVEDTEIYKSIGTHENFRVHKFHSQDDIEIRGNIHHIFSANNVPTFNDKGWSARRRTYIIPFGQRFDSDPGFEERTFTPEFFGRLVSELCKYAIRLKSQNYRYKWSAATLAAKSEYDTDANNAEEYAKYAIGQGIVAFDGFNQIRIDYDNWCADHGYVPLGITNLRRALFAVGFEQASAEHGKRRYKLPSIKGADLIPINIGKPGIYTTTGFEPTAPSQQAMPMDTEQPKPKKQILKDGGW